MFVDHRLALLASDMTTPDELTLTSLDVAHDLGIVASPTAQKVTTAGTPWVFVALPARGSDDALCRVVSTVIRRRMHVDEFLVSYWLLSPFPISSAELLLGTGSDANRIFIAPLQIFADFFETWHRLPTRLHRAGAGNTVTSTAHVHLFGNGLKVEKNNK